ncbi:MAG: NAD(P)/FAD-dependent oxidoreductase, partial [Nocardioidaceae bacterium]
QALPVTPRLITATWFPRRRPDEFTLERTPVAIRVGEPAFSSFPTDHVVGIKVVANGKFTDVADPEGLPRSVGIDDITRASAAVRETLPGVTPDPVRVGTYCDLFTPDGHAFVGPPTDGSAVVLATGFCGHGFKLAPAFGRAVARLATDKQTDHDLSFLHPSRLHSTVDDH